MVLCTVAIMFNWLGSLTPLQTCMCKLRILYHMHTSIIPLSYSSSPWIFINLSGEETLSRPSRITLVSMGSAATRPSSLIAYGYLVCTSLRHHRLEICRLGVLAVYNTCIYAHPAYMYTLGLSWLDRKLVTRQTSATTGKPGRVCMGFRIGLRVLIS